ncbi:hypothetical protein P4H79_30890 [Paenibacillus anseongense]|nr:hypothetical protein [Paenibacillus anseongense]MEC0270290.1 hypothetical protein [Paenibacillus anseongense]
MLPVKKEYRNQVGGAVDIELDPTGDLDGNAPCQVEDLGDDPIITAIYAPMFVSPDNLISHMCMSLLLTHRICLLLCHIEFQPYNRYILSR